MYGTVREFISALGGHALVAARLGMKSKTLHSHVASGVLPSTYYRASVHLAHERGVPPPPDALFNFKPLLTMPAPEKAA